MSAETCRPPDRRGAALKVLIVEDDQSLAAVIERNFRARGYACSTVDTAEAAGQRLAEDWPYVLILDVNLPDYSAWEVLRRLGGPRTGSRSSPSRRRRSRASASTSSVRPGRCRSFPFTALLHLVEQVTGVDTAATAGERSDLA